MKVVDRETAMADAILKPASIVPLGIYGPNILAGSGNEGFTAVRQVITSRGALDLVTSTRDLPRPGAEEQGGVSSIYIPKGSNPRLVPEGFQIKDGEEVLRVFGWARRVDGSVRRFVSAPVEAIVMKNGTTIRNLTKPEGTVSGTFKMANGVLDLNAA